MNRLKKIKFDKHELGIIINSLNEMRNKLILGGEYTDPVDELLLKIIEFYKKK